MENFFHLLRFLSLKFYLFISDHNLKTMKKDSLVKIIKKKEVRKKKINKTPSEYNVGNSKEHPALRISSMRCVCVL